MIKLESAAQQDVVRACIGCGLGVWNGEKPSNFKNLVFLHVVNEKVSHQTSVRMCSDCRKQLAFKLLEDFQS